MMNKFNKEDAMAEQIINEYANNLNLYTLPHSKNAFVTFMIMNDSFLPGALMFAYGLRCQNVSENIVCLISVKISKGAVSALHCLFDKVIYVDEVFINHEMRHQRQDRPYLFSRFNALRLGKDGDLKQNYKKIILCDADLYPVKNYSKLFSLPAPAGILNEHKEHCMEYDKQGHYIWNDIDQSQEWCWHSTYNKICSHGQSIPEVITNRVKSDYDNMGVNASLWVLEPSQIEYEMIMEDINTPETNQLINHFKWPEMQYATVLWSGQWTNVDIKYSSFNGYPKLDILNGLHYAGTKPWKHKNLKHLKHFFSYPDYYFWYMKFIDMMNTHNKLFSLCKLSMLYSDITQVLNTIY